MQSQIYSVTEGVIEDVQQGTRSERAITVTAKGWVPTSGWSQPDLLPFVYIVPPADGLLDLDFVATHPTGIVLQVFSKIGITKNLAVPDWVKGVRIHSSTNSVVADIGSGVTAFHGGDLPFPFDIPWWAPKAKPR